MDGRRNGEVGAAASEEREEWLTREVTNPVGVRVTGEDDGIVDLILVEVVEDPVAVRAISVPCVLNMPLSVLVFGKA